MDDAGDDRREDDAAYPSASGPEPGNTGDGQRRDPTGDADGGRPSWVRLSIRRSLISSRRPS
jgi:hypothetical protein